MIYIYRTSSTGLSDLGELSSWNTQPTANPARGWLGVDSVVSNIVSNKRRDSLVGDQLGIGTKKKLKQTHTKMSGIICICGLKIKTLKITKNVSMHKLLCCAF